MLVLGLWGIPEAAAQRGLPAAVRARAVGQGVRQLVVSMSAWNYPAFLLSFNRHLAVPWDRLAAVPAGTAVDADLWVEPQDPEIASLGSTFEDYRRQGSDVRVSLILARERATGNASPSRMAQLVRADWPYRGTWQRGLSRAAIGPGTLFAVEANSGAGYLVLVSRMTERSISLRYFEYEFGD